MNRSANYERLSFAGSLLAVGLSVSLVLVATVTVAEAQQQPAQPKQLLAKNAGTWDCDIKMFFGGPQAKATAFKGVEESTLVCGGKFLQTSFNYSMGGLGKFEGHSLIGYDPRSKRFVGTWVDNKTSVPARVNEEYDEKSNTLTDLRTIVDGAGNESKSKLVTTWLDDSMKKLEIFMIVKEGDKENEVKLMEIISTKRE